KRLDKGRKWKIKMIHTKNASISFRSSNKKVATVSKGGVVQGKHTGNARITVTVANGGVIDQYYVVLRVTQKGVRTDMSYLKEIRYKSVS
ncbi:MAG: Ig-like domain-containing protein, partial [Eubacterium sp.]|nr:Ig-like domain-containing protein [Eubacterium sp.]